MPWTYIILCRGWKRRKQKKGKKRENAERHEQDFSDIPERDKIEAWGIEGCATIVRRRVFPAVRLVNSRMPAPGAPYSNLCICRTGHFLRFFH